MHVATYAEQQKCMATQSIIIIFNSLHMYLYTKQLCVQGMENCLAVVCCV